ncbi:MAG: anthranilate synthase component II [Selenomonadaceae bacterium]
MFLMIDNYDSFVYNLVRYMEELGAKMLVRCHDEITLEEIETLAPEGILLSPGPKRPEDAGIMLEAIAHFQGKIPMLGVCLGFQAIGQAFGGKTVRGERPMHGKLSLIHHDGQGIFAGVKNPLRVTRYHSLILDRRQLPSCFVISSETEDGVIMGIRHRHYKIEGVQFHPEAELSEAGHQLLENFIALCRKEG